MKLSLPLFLVLFSLVLSCVAAQDDSKMLELLEKEDTRGMEKWIRWKLTGEIVIEKPPRGLEPGEHKFLIERPEGVREYYLWVPKVYILFSLNASHVFF